MKIIHVDMDAFYASVEQRDDPALRGRPVVVGGPPESRGVVAAASYEARKFGIHSAMPSQQAYRRCPHAIFVPPRMEAYSDASRQIRRIFYDVTPLVEPLSLDEAYLDVTENLLDAPLARDIARYIKDRIRDELGLVASAGVGPNKFIAKIASDWDKPDGLVVIPPSKVEAFVARLPVERLWGVGPATARRLHHMGLLTAADIRARPLEELKRTLGKHGAFLHSLSRGVDPRRVTPRRPAKSRGSERTFAQDVHSVEVLIESLEAQASRVARTLVRAGHYGRTITLKVRYHDFETVTRSRTLGAATQDGDAIAAVAVALLRQQTHAASRPVRLIGLSVGNFRGGDEPEQLPLPLPL